MKQARVVIPVSPVFSRVMETGEELVPVPVRGLFVIFKSEIVEKVFETTLIQDGDDGTNALLKVFDFELPTIHYILLKGITLAGLNYIDVFAVNFKTKVPIIILHKHDPHKPSLKKLDFIMQRKPRLYEILKALPQPVEYYPTKDHMIKVTCIGTTFSNCKGFLRQLSWEGYYPTVLRVAQRIARPIKI